MYKIFRIIVLSVFLCSVLVFYEAVFAQPLDSQILHQVETGAVNAQLTPDYNQEAADPREIIAGAIKVILSLLGTIFLLLVLSGGYVYLTAGGDEGRVSKARSTITNGIIGLVIVLAAYSITLFVLRGFERAVDDGQGVTPSDIRQNSDILNERLNEGDFF